MHTPKNSILATRARRPICRAVQTALVAVSLLATQNVLAQAGTTSAASAEQKYFKLDAGPLATALEQFARTAGVNLAYDEASIRGVKTSGIAGHYTSDKALTTLLAGSGFEAKSQTGGGYVLRKVTPAVGGSGVGASGRSDESVLAPVVVVAQAMRESESPRVYAGGQTARGGRVGMLGNQDFMDTPHSVTAYTGELMASQNAHTVADVLENDPSVRFTTPAGHMIENFYIRGFLVTADNIAMNGLFGVAPYGHVTTEFVERVEILKGPTALQYGMSPTGAVGGTVNLVPKRAGDEPLNRIGLEYVSNAQIGTTLDVGRRFGADNEFGARFSGAFRDGESAVDDESKTLAIGALALDYRGAKARASLDAYVNKDDTENGSPMMVSFDSTVISPPDVSTNLFKGTYSTMKNRGVVLRGDVDVSDAVNVYGAVGKRKNSYAGFINGTRANYVLDDGSYTGWTVHQKGYTDTQTYETGVSARFETFGVKHRAVLGASSLDIETGTTRRAGADYASNIYAPTTPDVAAHPGEAYKTQDTTLSGLALSDTLSVWQDRVALTLGVRRQNIKDKSYNSLGTITANYDKTVNTPALGLVVKPWGDALAFYANYVEGLTQGGTAPQTAANANEVFAPYVTKQKEFGVKWDAKRFAHTVSVFEILEPSLVRDTATNIYSVDGEKRVRGVEWSFMGQALPQLRVLGGLTLARGKQIRASAVANDGKEAYGVPHWQGNLGADWDVPWVSGLSMNARAVHTAAQYLNSSNTLKIPSWTRYDAGVRYATTINALPTNFRLFVYNVFNKSYWAGPYHGEDYTTLSAPRTVSLSATVDF